LRKGINIDGQKLNYLRFADDIVLTSDDLRKAKLEDAGMSERIELVNEIKFHEIRISRDHQTCELCRKIGLGWAVYGRLKHVFDVM